MNDFFILKNDTLEVKILRKGAELCSVKNSNDFEFIWQAGEAWRRYAPNLFPVVGSLLDYEYEYEGNMYPLEHHGFARDLDFDVYFINDNKISLLLKQNEHTLKRYPFDFELYIDYELENNSLKQTFKVINNNTKEMPVSFGGHPAFAAQPVHEYQIHFSQKETNLSNRLEGPYIGERMIEVIQGNTIQLTNDIFNEDALIFQSLKSNFVELVHMHSNHKVRVSLDEFPYLGIWSKPQADYVCIEPWQGLADFVNHNKKILDKKGIYMLTPSTTLCKSFTMEFFQ